jgi:integrase
MIKPWKNPRSEFWWFRRRIPKQYLKFGMPAEIKFSLGTKDLREAEILCLEENLRFERAWRAGMIGAPPNELSHLQIVALAGEFYAEIVAAHRDEPGPKAVWEDHLRAIADVKSRRILPSLAWLKIAYGEEARSFLERKGLRLIGQRFDSFLQAFVDAKTRAAGILLENAKGNYSKEMEKKAADRYPEFEIPREEQQLDHLWALFRAAKKLSASTRKKWEPYFEALCLRIESRDMSRVTERHLLDWRDALLASIPSPITVRDGHIAAAKAFFGWAKRAKKLPTDPSAEVTVEISKKKHKVKMRGFNDDEAAIILSAALAPMSALMSVENAASRKWVPWLCAYTGARVNEITQARASDIKPVDGIPCIRITPEAGTVKTATERTVPLHPHLIELGFLDYVNTKRGEAPLFYSRKRQRNVSRKNPTYTSVGNKLAEWVRGLGIKDPRAAPNHGWRHRFKTEARKVRMDAEVRDAIQGHAPRTEGEDYGEVPVEVMYAELLRLPRYEVAAGELRDKRRRGQRKVDAAIAA